VNAKLRTVEEECESLRRALSVEVDGRRELEGRLMFVFCDLIACEVLFYTGCELMGGGIGGVEPPLTFQPPCVFTFKTSPSRFLATSIVFLQ